MERHRCFGSMRYFDGKSGILNQESRADPCSGELGYGIVQVSPLQGSGHSGRHTRGLAPGCHIPPRRGWREWLKGDDATFHVQLSTLKFGRCELKVECWALGGSG